MLEASAPVNISWMWTSREQNLVSYSDLHGVACVPSCVYWEPRLWPWGQTPP